MTGDREQALVFGEIATDYERVRPGYPTALIDDVIAYAPADPTALDIGAGTGKATVAFADRGVRIIALEPDPAMAVVLRERVAGQAVNIAVASLEDHEPAEPYDLVYSAQAFHWTAPETRWARTASVLRLGGALALFWNHDRLADPAVRDEVFGMVHEQVPMLAPAREPHEPEELLRRWPQDELVKQPEFGEFRQQVYRWQRELSRADYTAYLTTQSAYRMLDDEVRQALVDELQAVLPEQVVLDVATLLYLAKRLW
jgi:SAM-dependent methyltransferase